MQVMNRFLNRLPTITIREGHRVKVYLTSDLELPAYRADGLVLKTGGQHVPSNLGGTGSGAGDDDICPRAARRDRPGQSVSDQF